MILPTTMVYHPAPPGRTALDIATLAGRSVTGLYRKVTSGRRMFWGSSLYCAHLFTLRREFLTGGLISCYNKLS